jgi:hypothetical protein
MNDAVFHFVNCIEQMTHRSESGQMDERARCLVLYARVSLKGDCDCDN